MSEKDIIISLEVSLHKLGLVTQDGVITIEDLVSGPWTFIEVDDSMDAFYNEMIYYWEA